MDKLIIPIITVIDQLASLKKFMFFVYTVFALYTKKSLIDWYNSFFMSHRHASNTFWNG